MFSPEDQLRQISAGAAEIVPGEALVSKLASGKSLTVKLGVDPTAPDLHLGHAVPLRKLRQFQDLGHTVVLIVGDFTALIGDPSGRNTIRPPLTEAQVEANAATYIEQAFRVLDPSLTQVRHNSEWLAPLNFADILKLTSMFTVARLLERDDFQKRFREGVGISLHEMLYPLAQAYDSVVIKADVEIGGTDQLFNLLAGRELMERHGMEPQVCLTLPLLEGTDGVQKMSKAYGNYIGLTDKPSEMFGKVMSIPDEIMIKYYRTCLTLPTNEVDDIERGLAAGTLHPNVVKRELAKGIVALYHGPEAAIKAEESFDLVFKRHEIPAEVAVVEVDLTGEIHVPALLHMLGMAVSRGEGRRLIDQGGVKINGIPLAAASYNMEGSAIEGNVIQVGKRRFVRVFRKRNSRHDQ